MEVFVVSFGDSYDRFVVGVARSLDEARGLARNYLGSAHYAAPYTPDDGEHFTVMRLAVGVADDHAKDVHLNLDA